MEGCLKRRHLRDFACFPDGVGIGAQADVNSLQLCHFVFLTTLCPQKKELSQRPVLFCGRSLTELPQGNEVS